MEDPTPHAAASTRSVASAPYPRIDDLIPWTSISLGVTLHIDRANEDYYLEVTPDHDPTALAALQEVALGRQLDLIPEDECEPEVFADGTVRIYLYDTAIDQPIIDMTDFESLYAEPSIVPIEAPAEPVRGRRRRAVLWVASVVIAALTPIRLWAPPIIDFYEQIGLIGDRSTSANLTAE